MVRVQRYDSACTRSALSDPPPRVDCGRLARPATAPPRRFNAADLAALEPASRRRICHALLAESGAHVVDVESGADFVDFAVESVPVWRPRGAWVRLLYRAATPADVTRLGDFSSARRQADAVLIESVPSRIHLPRDERVSLIRAAALVERMEASALIRWYGGLPTVDRELFTFLRKRGTSLARLDSIGFRWLPWLGRNKVPPLLRQRATPADALLEEASFRTFVFVFAFSGERLGARFPGSARPDALLLLPDNRHAALLDCKAARDGYTMSRSDYRALREYVDVLKPELSRVGRTLKFVVILSSDFPGASDRRHPYFRRAREFKTEADVELVYLRTDDVTRFALRLEESSATPIQRQRIDWVAIFEQGRPDEDALVARIP
jgi:hypothetical protein